MNWRSRVAPRTRSALQQKWGAGGLRVNAGALAGGVAGAKRAQKLTEGRIRKSTTNQKRVTRGPYSQNAPLCDWQLFGAAMVASDGHRAKPPMPIDRTEQGSVTAARAAQLSKAYLSNDSKPSPNVTFVSAAHSENAPSPIDVQSRPIATFVRAVHLQNAHAAMASRREARPPSECTRGKRIPRSA
jgi:hypothetical protein